MSYAYYEKTGYMFEGSEMEFQNRLPKCNCFMPWTDDNGEFEYFLCTKDFEKGFKEVIKNNETVKFVIPDKSVNEINKLAEGVEEKGFFEKIFRR